MGKYANSTWTKWLLYGIAAIVSALNIMLLISELL
jgi:manganese transport protein